MTRIRIVVSDRCDAAVRTYEPHSIHYRRTIQGAARVVVWANGTLNRECAIGVPEGPAGSLARTAKAVFDYVDKLAG